jgi:virulence factor Mce-like protein
MSGFFERAAEFPSRFARGARRFIDPPLKVGRIPFGRTVLIMLFATAVIFLGYTAIKKDVEIPFISNPYLVDVIVPDAQGLNPAKEPSAGVAGVEAGKVVAVRREGTQARVTLRLENSMRGKIFNDATAFVRPTSLLQTLIVNILPGDPATGKLPEGRAIPVENTRPFVHIDDLTGILDADTQAQVQVLIAEAATAFDGRAPELRKILSTLGDVTDEAQPLADALAERRHLLARLTTHLDVLFNTLGDRGRALARAIDSGSRTLEVTASRDAELASAMRGLAPTVSELQRSLAATGALAKPLVPALDRLLPVAREIEPTSRQLRDFVPEVDQLVGEAKSLVRVGSKPASQLAGGLKGLAGRIQSDQIPALKELLSLADLLHKYRNGFIQFAENLSGATSVNKRAGTYLQVALVNAEIDPEMLGLSASAAKTGSDGESKLTQMLGKTLEYICQESNPMACLLRFNIPGLSSEPLTVGKGG